MPPPADNAAVVAWSQASHYATRLFEALDRLDEAGGSGRAAAAAGWSPSTLDKAIANLQSTQEALDVELARLRARQRHFPRRRRIARSREAAAELVRTAGELRAKARALMDASRTAIDRQSRRQ